VSEGDLGMRCVGYNFGGDFEDNSYETKDEEGNEIPNIKEYYCDEDDIY
jgi:hypothetical protein